MRKAPKSRCEKDGLGRYGRQARDRERHDAANGRTCSWPSGESAGAQACYKTHKSELQRRARPWLMTTCCAEHCSRSRVDTSPLEPTRLCTACSRTCRAMYTNMQARWINGPEDAAGATTRSGTSPPAPYAESEPTHHSLAVAADRSGEPPQEGVRTDATQQRGTHIGRTTTASSLGIQSGQTAK